MQKRKLGKLLNALLRLPIIIYYGENIPSQPMAIPSQDQWRARLAMARLGRTR